MSLYDRFDADLKAAMTAKDAEKTSVIRFLKSALKYSTIEKKVEKLPDADILQIIQKQIKQRRESIDQFTKGKRADLAKKEAAELAILETYLPKQVTGEELVKIVQAEVQVLGASSKKDFGRVMKSLNEKLAGQADAKSISEALNKLLP